MRERFRSFAGWAVTWGGSLEFFTLSVVGIVVWAVTGPLFSFSDTWQLLVNTPTTVLTFLLGILILYAADRQSRESKVVHDEILQALRGARNELVDIDDLTDEQLRQAAAEQKRRAQRG